MGGLASVALLVSLWPIYAVVMAVIGTIVEPPEPLEKLEARKRKDEAIKRLHESLMKKIQERNSSNTSRDTNAKNNT